MRNVLVGLAAMAALAATASDAQTYTYDDLGRVKTVTPASGSASSYSYDSADNRTSVVIAPPSANHAPVCTANVYTFPIPTTVPPYAVSVTAASVFTANCTDSDGDTLTLVSPGLPLNFTISSGQYIPYAFTVSDGHGGTSASVIENFHRP